MLSTDTFLEKELITGFFFVLIFPLYSFASFSPPDFFPYWSAVLVKYYFAFSQKVDNFILFFFL